MFEKVLPEAPEEKKEVLSLTAKVEEQKSAEAEDNKAESQKKTLRDIYWVSPFSMFSFLLLGAAMSIGHHRYYSSLVGQVFGDVNAQQNTRRLGNFFALVVQVSLATSMGFAYTQWLWMTLKDWEVTINGLNAAFAARSSLLFLFNAEMLWKIKTGSLLALTAWCLPIPSLITPATLFVNPTNITYPIAASVPCLDIADPSQANHFTYSVPANGPDSPNNQSMMFLGPRTIISRLSIATAATGEILPISPPFVNSSYQIQFYGPMVQCQEANATVSAIMDRLVYEQMQTQDNVTQILNAYFAYVPDLSTPESVGGLINRLQQPSNGSNQLWLSFKRNGTGYTDQPIPTCPTTEYRVCQLYNASYDLNLTFVEGNQIIQGYPPTILNTVDYPTVNLTAPSDMAQHAYSAFMWAFTNGLVGTMGFYNDSLTDRSTPAEFSEIKTDIENTSLLGSSDLDCFFATNNVVSNATSTPSSQRVQDIQFAGNQTLDILIPELAFNTTVSFMNDELLAPLINTTVSTTHSLNLYAYHSTNLLLSYGVAILIGLIANVLGTYAYYRNGVSHDTSFSSIVSSTTDISLTTVFRSENPETRGKLPLPRSIATEKIKFTPLDEGGLGFQTADEVKRRLSCVPK